MTRDPYPSPGWWTVRQGPELAWAGNRPLPGGFVHQHGRVGIVAAWRYALDSGAARVTFTLPAPVGVMPAT